MIVIHPMLGISCESRKICAPSDFAFAVAPDNGAGAGVRTPAGGLADFAASL